MAGPVRPVRSTSDRNSGVGASWNFFSYRNFVMVMFALLFLAALSVLITTTPSTASNQDDVISRDLQSNPDVIRTFLALKSDPAKTRVSMIYKQASDHIALVNAYSAYARKLKLENVKQLRTFENLAKNFSDLFSKPLYKSSLFDPGHPIEEDVLRQFEKETKDRIKFARQLIAETKESFDNQLKIQKLRDTIFAVNEQLTKAKKQGVFSSFVAAKSIPKSLHCLAMRLMEERIAHPKNYTNRRRKREFDDPTLYHYAILSNNVIAASVVVNSTVMNAKEPKKHVFHIVTDKMSLAAMQVWFTKRPPERGAHVEIKAMEEFRFLNSNYVPILRQAENAENAKHILLLKYLRFYLPEMFPKLHHILFLDDDVVVQKDLSSLWGIDMEGKVNGAVETCFGSFRRYAQYLNFSSPLIREKFNPKACAWAYGVNFFDLDAWRREKCTEEYHYWQNLNKNESLWKADTLPPGLVTFYSTTKPLSKFWHVLGLGYNPSVSMDEIRNAAVIHFNGNMKPWLDIAMTQFRPFWTKYIDYDMEFVQMCNFGL